MRIVRYVEDYRTAHGIEHPDGTITRLSGDILEGPRDTREPANPAKILAPIEPRAIIGIGLNYRRHAEETGKELPETPVVFMKNPAAVQNPGDPIVIPSACTRGPEVDYECELAVVIGKAARNISESDALTIRLGKWTRAAEITCRNALPANSYVPATIQPSERDTPSRCGRSSAESVSCAASVVLPNLAPHARTRKRASDRWTSHWTGWGSYPSREKMQRRNDSAFTVVPLHPGSRGGEG